MIRFGSALVVFIWLATAMPLVAEGVEVPIRVTNGNIRFGPSTQAPVVVTLPRGTMVTVLGPVAGQPGWYRIRFPRQGGAWMHERNLQLLEDGRHIKVMADSSRVRNDSRINAELVAQVDAGTVDRKSVV
jgi:uncharacterized protein YraI